MSMYGSRAKTAGTIKVHKPELIHCWKENEVTKDDLFLTRSLPLAKEVSSYYRPPSSHYVNGWLSEKSIKNVQEKTDYESSSIKNMYLNLLENEEKLQEDLDDVLIDDIITKRRKIHLLLKKWHEKAYIPLNKKITEEMNSECYRQLDKEKRKEYMKYLKHRNNKGHIFLDIYEKEEYDPLYLNSQRPGPIKAVTEKLNDPLLHQQHKRNEEDRVVLACDLGIRLTDKQVEYLHLPPLPLVPLGRHGTKCSTWLDMKLTDIQSDVRLRSQGRRYSMRNNSSAFVQETDESMTDLEIFDKRNKWRKRRQFSQKHDANVELI